MARKTTLTARTVQRNFLQQGEQVTTPDGVAIFRRDYSGKESPICFVWDTDLSGINRAWKEAVELLSAQDVDELRQQGCFARLVSLTPLMEVEIGKAYLADDCAKLVEYELGSGSEVILKSREIQLPVKSSESVLPEFPVYVWDYFHDEEIEVELNLCFVLKERTSTHAIYDVRELSNSGSPQVKGSMTPSHQSLHQQNQQRKSG